MQAPVGPNYICLVQWAILQCVFLLLTKTVIVLAGPRYSSRIVETKSGAIRGVILELNSRHLEPVEVFKAIPYALPPVGNQRFEEPKSLPPWKGTKLADTFGPVCPQNFPDITNRTAALMYMPKGRYQYLKRLIPLLLNQSEDCLTLNVYIPGSDILARCTEYFPENTSPVGFWLGPQFVIGITDPQDAEVVINHPSSTHKGAFYQIAIDTMGGAGLLTASGDYWKYHRRLLDPTIQNTKILNSYYPTINNTLRILVDILNERNEKNPNEISDIFESIEACSFDLFAKTTLGVDCNIQREHCSFFESLNEGLFVLRKRVFEPIYNIKPIFRMSKLYPMAKRATKDMRAVVQDIVRKRIATLATSDQSHQKEDEYERRLRIFVDEAIQLTTEEKCFTEDEMITESLTILMTGFETSAVSIANSVLMLALHPEYQDMVYQEIQKICPDIDKDVTAEELKELSFTERFIKESMRLIPTVPLIGRFVEADFYIGKTYVPAGCDVAISAYHLHRNKNVWGSDANTFNPDRFLPERFEKQHPYSYLPYSAGNRGLEAPYAVFFYVHGESFEFGSGNPYDGSVLASYGHIIVITVNFRLGILGFIKTRASTTPGSGGNLGLMDILAALHWTRDNIAAFGGDPSRVTIVGHDTGAALANLVLISKAGKALIHRAILLSGSALSPWSIIPDPDSTRVEVSQQMACHLDTNGNNRLNKDVTNDITNCLRSKPLEAIMGVRLPNVRFMPSWGPFLPLDDAPDPESAMEHAGQGFITKEVMIGMTTTESYNDFNAADIQYGLEEEQRNRLLRTYIRNAFSFHLNEIFSAVRNEYTDWDKPIQHPINIRDSTMEALSDGHTVAPLIKVGYLHARRGAKTYLFHFGYQTKDSEYPQRLGSVRGEDLPYIFGLPLVLGMPNFSQNFSRQDMGVAEAILNFVTNFCKTGDPNEAGHQQAMLHPDYGTARERTRYRGITWETYETTSQQYLSISLKPKMKSHYRGHKMAVWLNLIPQLHRPGDTEVSMRHHHFREREPHYYAGNVREESFTRPKQYYQNGVVNGAQESRQEAFGPECTPDPTLGESLLDTEEPLTLNEEEEELLQRLATRHYYSSYTAALGVTVGVGCLLLVLNMLIFAGIYYQRERSRRKTRTTRCNNGSTSGHGSPADGGDIPLTVRPGSSPGKSKQEPPPSYTTLQRSPCTHRDKGTLNKSMCDAYKQQNIQSSQHHHTVTLCQNQHPKNASTKTHNPPQPPTRTSSNPPSSNVNQIEKQLEHHTQVHQQQGGICGNNGSGVSEIGSGSGIGCSSSSGTSCKRRVQIQEITV